MILTKTFPHVRIRLWHGLVAVLLAAAGAMLVAQMEGERGVPPIASGGDFEVTGIKVDIYAANAQAARFAGWRQAQRVGWRMLWNRTNGGTGVPALSDSQLEGIVSGVEIESEQIGPNRYIATLGVLFDRARAGQILGVHGSSLRSPPLLLIPVLWQGGVATSYETINEWQKGWARFRNGESAIDYVRIAGNQADPVLLNMGQTGRRGRNWWRVLLDQYGAADVLMPIARLERQWPGGPVIGRFAARYGPDDMLIGTFSLRAPNEAGIPAMMDDAVRRIDQLYVQALNDGTLRTDPSLVIDEPVDPSTLGLDNAADAVVETTAPVATAATASVTIQYDTPNVGSVSQIEGQVRGIAGVRSASTSSLALGGVSVMQVNFDGSVEMLRTALQARGFTVSAAGSTLRITRRGTGVPESQ